MEPTFSLAFSPLAGGLGAITMNLPKLRSNPVGTGESSLYLASTWNAASLQTTRDSALKVSPGGMLGAELVACEGGLLLTRCTLAICQLGPAAATMSFAGQ